ncbi:MAG: DUF4493 domain-containing protein [Rikenellaceae bacterium]|nr:DUF4493 domain-containing protein [Rikenellaceae bacterium]
MKSVVKMMGVALTALLTLGACKKDKVDYIDPNDSAKDNVGYLLVGGMEASILEDTENISSPAATRADGLDINAFDVVITNQAGDEMVSFKYGERPSEPIALEGGVYKIAMSSAKMEGAAWETPVYAGEKEVIITRKQTTEVSDLVCKLANIKVTVDYSADLAEQLDENFTKMTVELENSGLEYAFSETRAGYFAPVAVDNTLKLTFNCRYKGETKDITMTNEIKGVKAAQWRKINVVVQHAADGTATIGIVCDTWTYDEEVTFDTSASLMEEVIPDDTDAPVIVWEGHDLTQPFELTDDMFDAEGNFTSSINIDVTAKAAIKSLVVKVSSDNADFTAAYSEIMALEEDLCAPTVSNTILKMMGYPTDAKDATVTRIKFASQAELLKSYEGTHSYEITVTDINGAHTTATLTVQYGQNVAPRIVWTGYDIDKQQTYAPGMTCDLKITAPLTIADMRVKIISATLTPEELAGVGLAGEFSLVNDTQYFESLKNLGFPVGDEVEGKSELDLSITNFLGVLNMLGAGDHNFEISVVDAEGNTTTKTVMMHFE